MSGRAYARNPSGALGGATDINSIIPHRFRLAAPKVTNRAKEAAIRRVIQRRCTEKNWRKLLRMRHTRLTSLLEPEEPVVAVENGVVEAPDVATENGPMENSGGKTEDAGEKTKDAARAENGDHAKANGKSMETEAVPPGAEVAIVTAKQRQQEALDKAKLKLQEMEETLKTLSAQKHEKFQQLKDMLIAEARSKSVPPMPKKRRVDSVGSVGGTSASPRLAGGVGGPLVDGMSLLHAPNPSLLRAQSFSGTSGIGSSEFSSESSQYIANQDTRQL